MSRHLFPPQGGTLEDAQKAAEAALMRQGFGDSCGLRVVWRTMVIESYTENHYRCFKSGWISANICRNVCTRAVKSGAESSMHLGMNYSSTK